MSWQLQEAKQRFSEVVRKAEEEGPQVVTRHGEEVAVVVSMAEWRERIPPKRDLIDVLLNGPTADLDIPPRTIDTSRDVDFSE
ncbi:MAG: type II toxin-antitoxin system Phd/YefM family antitoxin [Sporichthyaceae bacterium]